MIQIQEVIISRVLFKSQIDDVALPVRRFKQLPQLASLITDESGDFQVIQERNHTTVAHFGKVVIKHHHPRTATEHLGINLKFIRSSVAKRLFVQPLLDRPLVVEGRPLTVWQLGKPVTNKLPGKSSWRSYGAKLAQLHNLKPTSTPKLNCSGWEQRIRRGLDRIETLPPSQFRQVLAQAVATLPPDGLNIPGYPPRACVIHGDWHPGQMVWQEGDLKFIDVDDLGWGLPFYDLARPAAWFLSGLLPTDLWQVFLSSYFSHLQDPCWQVSNLWQHLEQPARYLCIQISVSSILRCTAESRDPDDAEQAMIRTCWRIASYNTEVSHATHSAMPKMPRSVAHS